MNIGSSDTVRDDSPCREDKLLVRPGCITGSSRLVHADINECTIRNSVIRRMCRYFILEVGNPLNMRDGRFSTAVIINYN